jgi:hypothetical protein
MQINKIRIVFLHFLLIILAIEVKHFFDKGGNLNELAYSLFKIMILLLFSILMVCCEDLTKTLITPTQVLLDTPRKLLSLAKKLN